MSVLFLCFPGHCEVVFCFPATNVYDHYLLPPILKGATYRDVWVEALMRIPVFVEWLLSCRLLVGRWRYMCEGLKFLKKGYFKDCFVKLLMVCFFVWFYKINLSFKASLKIGLILITPQAIYGTFNTNRACQISAQSKS